MAPSLRWRWMGSWATPTSGSEVQRNLVEGTDFSGTNNQETGVDESDIVKTDGEHIYMLHGSDLKIIAVPEFGSLEPASDTRIEGTPSSMMRSGDHLVVISNVNPWNIPTTHPLREAFNWGGEWNSWRSSQLTKFTVLDISNASSPEPVRELYIEGWSITAREVAGTVRAVTHGWMDILASGHGSILTIPTTPSRWRILSAERCACVRHNGRCSPIRTSSTG